MIEGQFYQIGYACDNLEEGIAQFRGRGMTHEPQIIEVDQPVNGPEGRVVNSLRIALIWIGDIQYEVIQAVSDPLGIYANAQSNGGPLRFHQLCWRIHGDWSEFKARVAAQDLPVAMEWDSGPEGLKFLYLDGRSRYGHYLEYTWMTEAAWNQQRAM
jgi:hypothetical protein